MAHRHLAPGTLWPAIERQTEHALRCGALKPVDTIQTVIESGVVRFVVRQVSSLARKEQQRRQARERQTQKGPAPNPFLPYEPDLFVADITDTHLALLNKFNVIDHHLLIVTRDFQRQEALLDLADFDALMACMAEFDGIGFYNGGPEAGASQPHKHLQIVPLPLGDAAPSVPVAPLLAEAVADGPAMRVPGLPFRHAFARMASNAPEPADTARTALACYHTLLEAAGIGAIEVNGARCQSSPYNLLVTREWMLLVPRSAEHVEGVSVNALGFAGSLFVRDAAHRASIERLGPMTVLQRAGQPWPQ
ncbi:ATP adenylyltransferase family protein [Paraburkholderia caribensis]|uniref:ATP adenylyltransferase family protein n=1 Tax=Paraburkholderia caribensis TaxID=75105 RepID=UPI0031D097BD